MSHAVHNWAIFSDADQPYYNIRPKISGVVKRFAPAKNMGLTSY